MAKSEYLKQRSKTDMVFSQYIRLSAADDQGFVRCVTCGKTGFWEKDNMHCGHYIRRAKMATRFNEMNCHVQCAYCNDRLKGNIQRYIKFMIKKHGPDEVETLETKAEMGGGLDTCGMKLLEKEYREKVKQLKKEKGL